MLLLIIIGIIILYFVLKRKFKFPKCNSMVCVTGAIKSGKSTFSLALAYKQYKRNLRGVKIRNFFRKLFHKTNFEEIPLFYTSVPVAFPHVRLTKELLLREERFAYKSVIWVDEASLLADSMSFKDDDVNTQLLLFNKLIAHETKGGTLVWNTQSVADLHYSIRRCLSEVFYVHDTFKWIPFFLVCTVNEERFSEDGSVMTMYNDDVEKKLTRVIIPKSIWRKFDCYCHSIHTDGKKVATNVERAKSLKCRRIVSFNPKHEVDMDKPTEKTINLIGGYRKK